LRKTQSPKETSLVVENLSYQEEEDTKVKGREATEEEELENTEKEKAEDSDAEAEEYTEENDERVAQSVADSPLAAYPLDASLGSAWSYSTSDWKETRTSARLRKTQSPKGSPAVASSGSLQEEMTSTAQRSVTTPAPVDSSSSIRSYRVNQTRTSTLRQVNADLLQSLSHTKTLSGKRKPRNKRQRMWTDKQDQRLLMSVQHFGKDWPTASKKVQTRTTDQCRQRWIYCLDPDRPNKETIEWTEQEDKTLLREVQKHGSRWTHIATTALPRRSNIQCQKRWANHIDPAVDRSKYNRTWTKGEDKKLIDAVQELGETDWDLITARLPGRNKMMTRRRWICFLDPSIDWSERKSKLKGSRWTPEEDKILLDAVNKKGKDETWKSIAKAVLDRTKEQCRHRYIDHLDPNIDRSVDANKSVGRWSAEEDKALLRAVKKCGTVWLQVGAMVPGRTSIQCRSRWIDHVDPSITRIKRSGHWTIEEDNKLLYAVQKHGKHWPAIVAALAGRSNEQCRKRLSIVKNELER
jgi:hypothetical protein